MRSRSLRWRIAHWLPEPARWAGARIAGMVTAPWARIRIAFGTRPMSQLWATDRGLAVHRYYLAGFLEEFSADMMGRCMEFQEGAYCERYGGSRVSWLEVLHLDDTNSRATIVADITKPTGIPADHFDCIVCTHVLHLIRDLDAAVAELGRILKPGGVLLVAVPGISMAGQGCGELWRFTSEGLAALLLPVFGPDVTIRAYGNSLTAAAELRGLVAHELSRRELDRHDPRFAVEVCARAIKPVQ
jgi:SAM-dependent methyltransferase